jgi:hypothetical protein
MVCRGLEGVLLGDFLAGKDGFGGEESAVEVEGNDYFVR